MMQRVARNSDAAIAWQLFNYHEGKLYWYVRPRRYPSGHLRTEHGWPAGGLQSDGYVAVRFKGKKRKAHHIVWLMHKGRWPVMDIDHKDGVRHHNWIDNLQELTESQNLQKQHRKKLPLSGHVGVQINSRGRFRASAYDGGVSVALGTYSKLEDAVEARRKYVAQHYVQ